MNEEIEETMDSLEDLESPVAAESHSLESSKNKEAVPEDNSHSSSVKPDYTETYLDDSIVYDSENDYIEFNSEENETNT